MYYLLIKAVVSAIIIVIVSETARRNPGTGALIASLPLISVLGMIWIWRDTQDVARLAEHSAATFWYVLPSLPMFLVIPALLKRGVGFWPALLAVCVLTMRSMRQCLCLPEILIEAIRYPTANGNHLCPCRVCNLFFILHKFFFHFFIFFFIFIHILLFIINKRTSAKHMLQQARHLHFCPDSFRLERDMCRMGNFHAATLRNSSRACWTI